MTENSLIKLVENAAKVRKDAPLPKEYIIDALKKIEDGDRAYRREKEIKKMKSGVQFKKLLKRRGG